MKGIILILSVILVLSSYTARGMDVYSDFDVNVEVFGTYFNINSESDFNPDNLLAQVPDYELDVQVRPNFALYYDDYYLSAKPRFGYRTTHFEDSDNKDPYSYFQEWSTGYVGSKASVSVGRELVLWGPSQFTSPSNPFFTSNNQSNPFIEPDARDFIQMQWYSSDEWDFSFLLNFDNGRDAVNYQEFNNIYAIKFGLTGYYHSSSIITSLRDGKPTLGLFTQWTLGDSLLLYGDFSLRKHSEALYPIWLEPEEKWDFQEEQDKNSFYTELLLGASYTFTNGYSVNLEYRYYQEGYNKSETEQYYSLVDSAANGLKSNEPSIVEESALLLLRASNPYLRSINQNYVYFQLLTREVIDNLSFNFLLSNNVDDASSQFTSVVSYYVSDRVRLSGYLNFGLGKSEGEYSRYYEDVHFVGLKYYL